MQPHRVQNIAITFNDGSIGIMHFVLDPRLPEGTTCEGYCSVKKERAATDAAIQAEIDKSVFTPLRAVRWCRIAAEDIPSDRTFRSAWRIAHELGSTPCVVHDMDECRRIHKERLRAQRKPLMEKLDVEVLRSIEDKTVDISSVAKRKQKLRDITADPRIESAATPEDLLQVILD